MVRTSCSNCGAKELYRSDAVSAAGDGHNLLPGLGRWFAAATFTVIVCQSCGLTQFFAAPEARDKLAASNLWQRVG